MSIILTLIRFLLKIIMKPVLVFLLSLLALVACERPMSKVQHGLPMPIQTFAHVERFDVDVGRVGVLIDDASGDDYSADFPVSLDDQVVSYFRNKVNALGGAGRLVVRVENSFVEHERLVSGHGVLEKIGVGHVDQYTMNLFIRLEHEDDAGRVIYGRSLKARKIVNVSEHDSLVEKDQKRFDAVEDLFDIIDPEVSRIIHSEMTL